MSALPLDPGPAPKPPKFRFGPFDRISIDGVTYRHVETTEPGHLLRRTDSSGLVEDFTHERTLELLAAGRLTHQRDYYEARKARVRQKAGRERLSELPPHEQNTVNFRVAVLESALRKIATGDAVKTEESLKAIIPAIEAEVAAQEIEAVRCGKRPRAGKLQPPRRDIPKPRTLLGWMRRYVASGCDPLALRDRYDRCGNKRDRFPAEAAALLHQEVVKYASDKRPSKAKVVLDVKARFYLANRERASEGSRPLPVPQRKAILRAINRLDPFTVCCGRHGPEAAKKIFGVVGRRQIVLRPLERVGADAWEIDLHSLAISTGAWEALDEKTRDRVKKVRRRLIVFLDEATRCVVAMRIAKTEDSAAGLAALQMVTMDKGEFADAVGALSSWHQHGGVETFAVDQGAPFIDGRFRAAVTDMGARLEIGPAGVPKLRGRIERLFGTIALQLMPRLSGRTFSNVVEKGDYDSEANAALTDDDLAEVLVRYIVDIYHRTPHEGLGGETPADAWERLTGRYGVLPPPDSEIRRAVFGIPLERTITDSGIKVLGNDYTCPEIADRFLHSRKRDVDVRLDPEDIGTISVNLDGQWLPVPCVVRAFDGVTLHTWIRAGTELRRRHQKAAEAALPIVVAAIRAIEEIDAAARRRRHLGPSVIGAAHVARAEREVFMGFSVEERPSEEPAPSSGGALGTSFPVGFLSPPEPTPASATPDQPISPPAMRRWTTKD